MRKADAGAIVVAAGRGKRFGGKKAFEMLGGSTVLERACAAVAELERVGAVVVAVAPEDVERAREILSRSGKPPDVVAGGELRQESVENAFDALTGDVGLVLVHDGSRPLATSQLARRVLAATEEWGACVPALPVVETLKRVTRACAKFRDARRMLVAETVPRDGLYSVQTPQGFRRELLEEALSYGRRRGLRVTDEAALVEACGRPVALVEGERANIKLTYREDLALAEVLLGERRPCARG